VFISRVAVAAYENTTESVYLLHGRRNFHNLLPNTMQQTTSLAVRTADTKPWLCNKHCNSPGILQLYTSGSS